jgi:hypothetical protein
MNRLQRTIYVAVPFWGLLGFYRGKKQYDYEHEDEMKKYNKELNEYNEYMLKHSIYSPRLPDKPYKYYITSFLYGLYGTVLYVNPFTLPVTFGKEIYRLEIVLRKLEDEKKTNFYKKVFW